MAAKYIDCGFHQGDDYHAYLDAVESGQSPIEYLAQWDFDEYSEATTEIPWAKSDTNETVSYNGCEYVIAENKSVGYVSLSRYLVG